MVNAAWYNLTLKDFPLRQSNVQEAVRYVRADFPLDSIDPVTIFPCELRSFVNLKVIREMELKCVTPLFL